ncbi:hypothetical protein WDW37_21335 [Bdellovibrionota bacterium FG-1]
MRNLLLGLGVISSVFFSWAFLSPTPGFSWGSFSIANTHQFLLDVAYDQLKLDPAFEGSGFPKLEDITAHEGVFIVGGDGSDLSLISGPGPDNPNTTPDSWHYYNPETGKGNAPEQTARYFKYLSLGIVKGTSKEAVNQGAAWGAHFLADMSVPYHVTGMPTTEALELTKGDDEAAAIPLEIKFTDDLYKMNYLGSGAHANDWKGELTCHFADSAARDDKADWFDPWYWNSSVCKSTLSSHMQWEAWVFHNWVNESVVLKGYSPSWKNPEPVFDNPWEKTAEAFAELARTSATTTRAHVGSWLTSSTDPLIQAATDIWTMWRASFTAIRALPFSAQGEADPAKQTYVVKVAVANFALETVKNVRVRLTAIQGATLIDGTAEQSIGEVESYPGTNKVGMGGAWTLKVPAPKEAKVRIEVIGAYSQVPDRQYYIFETRPEGLSDTLYYKGNAEGALSGEVSLARYSSGSIVGFNEVQFLGMSCRSSISASIDGTQAVKGGIAFNCSVAGHPIVYTGTFSGSIKHEKFSASYSVKNSDKPGEDSVAGSFELKVSSFEQ